MAGFSMDVIGLAEVMGKLGVMAAEAEVKAEEAVQGATQDALDASLPLIAVRTGYLLSRQQMRVSGLEGELYNDAPYSRWVNFGHHSRSGSWVAAQDFMTGPMEIGRRSLMERMSSIVLV